MEKERRDSLSRYLAGRYVLAALLLLLFSACLFVYARPYTGLGVIAVCILVAAVLEAIWLANCIRKRVSEPLDALRDVCRDESDVHGCGLLERNDEIGDLADELSLLMGRHDARIDSACEEAASASEANARSRMTEEICMSALPQVLPDYPSRAYFQIDGLLKRGEGKTCGFYDYFFIDPGLLCAVLGETPGNGVAEALYMVTAQTTIRSRLRQGRSLEETMADVNAQLYDLGSKFYLNALVATLNTADGKFTYVNAGQQRPLLMRNEERYEWLDSPVYAPLGMNENVSYRAMTLRLKQGDRLFLHTEGLGKLLNADGTPYIEQQLRADLNLSHSREMENDKLLAFLCSQALAYCVDEKQNDGFAALTLQFCRGSKDLAHCDVPANPAFASEVTDFLKRQFEDNGIDKRHYALQAVLVDEMFAICCRKVMPNSHIMVECGVAPDAQMVNIRITAMLGGVDPTESDDDPVLSSAIDFISEHADYVTFKPGENHDTITIVSFLE